MLLSVAVQTLAILKLPSQKVSEDYPPFTHVGLDFAGPPFIDDRNITERAKEWSNVYVCLAPIYLCVDVSSSV